MFIYREEIKSRKVLSRVDFCKMSFLGDGEDLFDDAFGVWELVRLDVW